MPLSSVPPSSPPSSSPPSSPPHLGTHTRATSVSAVAAIVHRHSQHQQLPAGEQPESTTPFQMHPWATERAKVAAESEISPPISPKQQAVVGGPQGGDFVEPLQESNSPNSIDDIVRRQSRAWNLNSDSSKNDSEHSSRRSCESQGFSHSRSASLSHPNSPYSHQPHPRPRSRARSYSNAELLAVLSRSELPALLSSPSSVSSSSSSSASSSSTSLSSVSSTTSASHALSSALTFHGRQHQNSSLKMLDTEKPAELFHIDTPPSSHVASPSSPSYPTLQGALPLDLTGSVDSSTTPKTPAVRPRTRAPYHCTQKSVPQIIREISDLVDGRDKTIKVVQYFAKVFLWVFLSNPAQYKVLATRIKALAKQFSTTRKMLRLGHFIDPLAAVLTLAVTLKTNLSRHGMRGTLDKTPSNTWKDTVRDRLGSLNSALGLCQDISDDIYCLGVIGVLDRSFADKAEPWSNRLWMVGVSIDLHENLQSIRDVKKQIRAMETNKPAHCMDDSEQKAWNTQHTKLTTKLHWLQVTTVKLGGDFLFCAYDNLHCSFSDGFQAVTGFVSGVAGAYKFVGKVMES